MTESISQTIITLGAMVTAGFTLIKMAEAFSARRKCDCSRPGDIEKLIQSSETNKRDIERIWAAINDLYARSAQISDLHHAVDKAVAVITTKLEK